MKRSAGVRLVLVGAALTGCDEPPKEPARASYRVECQDAAEPATACATRQTTGTGAHVIHTYLAPHSYSSPGPAPSLTSQVMQQQVASRAAARAAITPPTSRGGFGATGRAMTGGSVSS